MDHIWYFPINCDYSNALIVMTLAVKCMTNCTDPDCQTYDCEISHNPQVSLYTKLVHICYLHIKLSCRNILKKIYV